MSMERWFDEAKANTVEDVALYLVRSVLFECQGLHMFLEVKGVTDHH